MAKDRVRSTGRNRRRGSGRVRPLCLVSQDLFWAHQRRGCGTGGGAAARTTIWYRGPDPQCKGPESRHLELMAKKSIAPRDTKSARRRPRAGREVGAKPVGVGPQDRPLANGVRAVGAGQPPHVSGGTDFGAHYKEMNGALRQVLPRPARKGLAKSATKALRYKKQHGHHVVSRRCETVASKEQQIACDRQPAKRNAWICGAQKARAPEALTAQRGEHMFSCTCAPTGGDGRRLGGCGIFIHNSIAHLVQIVAPHGPNLLPVTLKCTDRRTLRVLSRHSGGVRT